MRLPVFVRVRFIVLTNSAIVAELVGPRSVRLEGSSKKMVSVSQPWRPPDTRYIIPDEVHLTAMRHLPSRRFRSIRPRLVCPCSSCSISWFVLLTTFLVLLGALGTLHDHRDPSGLVMTTVLCIFLAASRLSPCRAHVCSSLYVLDKKEWCPCPLSPFCCD